MPAVTADTLTLPRIETPQPDDVERPVRSISTAPRAFEGLGFPVRRAFAGVDLADLDPFIHMDEMGEVDYGPGEPRGTDWHPHRGFETVTYMIDGTFQHQDSNGGGGVITDGDTQWMTAGGGILHIETPPEQLVVSGGLFHGLQLWVNLPAKDKMTAPRYQSLEGGQVTLLSSPDGGALVRLIAGDIAGHRGPGSTHTPIAVAHATVSRGAELHMPWRPDFNALVYVLDGAGTAGEGRHDIEQGQLVVFGPGDQLTLAAHASRPLDALLLGGRPIREPVAAYGPFVMNTRAELQQAIEDFNAGRLGRVPANGLHPYQPGR
jgi:quercetin 2,3-dioxygenase